MTSRAWRISQTSYPAVRKVMGPERAEIDDEYLEGMLGELFPHAAPEDVEDFMGTLQRAANVVAPMAQKALPGIMQGAVQGATIGGPWGALAGAVGGGAMSLLGGGQAAAGGTSPAAPPPAAPSPPVAPAPASLSMGGAAGSNAAAAQLLALLSRPETMQALLALLMGNAGRPAVAAGTSAQAPAAFANAISELAAEAALQGSIGCSCQHGSHWGDCADCSQASPREHAARLMEQLSGADSAGANDTDALDDSGPGEEANLGDYDEEEEDMEDFEHWTDAYEAALEGSYVE